jgi:A/G-specific adenine glycosylase
LLAEFVGGGAHDARVATTRTAKRKGGKAKGRPAARTGTTSPAIPWSEGEIVEARRALLAHYDRHKRELPWRGESDPYRIWVSEVMLQQTRVEVVRERYHAFVSTFGSLRALASATEDRVLKAWEGLGYYGRARNLKRAAVAVESFHGGRLPGTASALAELPGFGAYTSAAVASIAFGEPVAVVDGNVARVVARLLDEDRDPTRGAVRARIAATAQALLDPSRPGDWNQAVMDLGATICVPRDPRCLVCPLAPTCRARAAGRTDRVPRRKPRAPVPHHVVAAGLVWRDGRVLVGKRPSEGLLGGLHELPGGKVERGETLAAACAREVREETGLDVEVVELFRTVEHAYTHFRVTLHVFHCRPRSGRLRARGTEDLRFVPTAELEDLAFPRANRRVLEDLRAVGAPAWAGTRAREGLDG